MTDWEIHREGRAWGGEAMARYEMAPDETELIEGRLFWSDDERLTMLGLLLENVGADAAVRLGPADTWRAAVASLDPSDDDPAGGSMSPLGEAERDALERRLIANLRQAQSELKALFDETNDHWGYEDPIYRVYHQSWKVFWLQKSTERIVERLQLLVPDRPLHPSFLQIVRTGTGRRFTEADNRRWAEATRPIVEAFFHARYLLDMAVRYPTVDTPPRPLPSGDAALLYLFGLR